MTDKEKFELAAKAAGISPCTWIDPISLYNDVRGLNNGGIWDYIKDSKLWNPRDDDGDSFRLAVKLGLNVCIDTPFDDGDHSTLVIASLAGIVPLTDSDSSTIELVEPHRHCQYAATRLAIFRAAVQIGEAMP